MSARLPVQTLTNMWNKYTISTNSSEKKVKVKSKTSMGSDHFHILSVKQTAEPMNPGADTDTESGMSFMVFYCRMWERDG